MVRVSRHAALTGKGNSKLQRTANLKKVLNMMSNIPQLVSAQVLSFAVLNQPALRTDNLPDCIRY